MTCRVFCRFGIVVLLGAVCWSRLTYAQSKRCVDSASPPPVSVLETKISIVRVEVEGENPLSDTVWAKLVEYIQRDHWATPEEPDSNWLEEPLYLIKDELRNLGYFKASVSARPYLVRALPNEKRYILVVIIESGTKYKLGTIHFTSATDTPLVLSEHLLRQQFQLQEGEPFDASKIREGLQAMGKLYGSRGYIDATPEPDTTINEEHSRIDLIISVDEQQCYRLAKTRVRGLSPQNELTLPQEIGDIFNPALWGDFFKENKLRFPLGASPERNMRTIRNAKYATLIVILDFRACPENQPLDD